MSFIIYLLQKGYVMKRVIPLLLICNPFCTQNASASKKPNLVFLGCQVTSNNPEQAALVEIAAIITDWQLNILAEGPSIIIYQSDAVLESMDDYFKQKYSDSGLLEKIRASTISLADAEAQILAFIKPYTQPKQSPMFGGIWFGRDCRTIRLLMPKLTAHLSTKALGTFVLRELVELWSNDTTHQAVKIISAMDDAHAAIEEMRYYKEMYFTKAF